MKRRLALLLVAFAITAENAFASMHFLPEPKKKVEMPQQKQKTKAQKDCCPPEQHQKHAGMPRKKPGMRLVEGEGASLTLVQPDGVLLSLEAKNGIVAVPKTGFDNYHALVAEKVSGNVVESAVRYLYLRGKPSGHSPSEITGMVKTGFEIVPDPLPREHWHYTAGRNAVFTLRFDNGPVSGTKVLLTTEKGTVLDAITDNDGKVVFTLPEDFETVIPGRRKNPPAEFRVEAETKQNEKHYRTSLTDKYYVNPKNWQSLTGGILVMILGMGTGLFFTLKNHRSATRKGGEQ